MDATEYRRASRAVWEAMAPGWDQRHRFVEQSMRPVADRMIDGLQPREGVTVLELASGTGVVGLSVASALAGQNGRVIVSDFSPAMVEAARRRGDEIGLSNVDYRTLDCEAIDLPDASVDAVVCRYAYMLVPDPGRALSEARRVLRPEGRVTCAVFAGPESNPWAAIPGRVLVELGHMPPPAPGEPGIFALADSDHLRHLLVGAGFDDPLVEEVPATFTFADEDDYWDVIERLAGAISMVLERLEVRDRTQVRAEVKRRIAPFLTDGRLGVPSLSLVALATRLP